MRFQVITNQKSLSFHKLDLTLEVILLLYVKGIALPSSASAQRKLLFFHLSVSPDLLEGKAYLRVSCIIGENFIFQ